MCATVCPSQALYYGPLDELVRSRKGTPVNRWQFGSEEVHTKVFVMAPVEQRRMDVSLIQLDGTAASEGSGSPASRAPEAGDAYDVAVLLGL